MPGRMWTRETVIAAIRKEAEAGHDLSYWRTEKRIPALLRAAQRVFGHWSTAVEASGFDYEAIRLYRKWTRERVIERIRELHAKGEDLSWRNVSLKLDPSLAAATLHADRFESWAEALQAAGLNPEKVMKYRKWTKAKVREALAELAHKGASLDRDTLAEIAPATLAAIYRVGAGLVAEREAINLELKY